MYAIHHWMSSSYDNLYSWIPQNLCVFRQIYYHARFLYDSSHTMSCIAKLFIGRITILGTLGRVIERYWKSLGPVWFGKSLSCNYDKPCTGYPSNLAGQLASSDLHLHYNLQVIYIWHRTSYCHLTCAMTGHVNCWASSWLLHRSYLPHQSWHYIYGTLAYMNIREHTNTRTTVCPDRHPWCIYS